MPPTIHLVRHAQGYHNLTPANQNMRDPRLTPLGEEQCRKLKKTFPHHSQVDRIVASPLKRTIYTALLSFEDDLARRHLKVIALPEVQEESDLPCDTGSEVEEVQQEFEGKPVDLSLLERQPDWCSKRGKWAPTADAVTARAREARRWLRDQKAEHIVVVTHGGFLHYFTEDWGDHVQFAGTGWANTEFRSYTFDPNSGDNAFLVETEESRRRRSGTEKPLTEAEQRNLEEVAHKTREEQGFQKTEPPHEIQAKV